MRPRGVIVFISGRPEGVNRQCAHPRYSRSLVTKKKSPLEKDNSCGAFARRDSAARITLSGMKLLAEVGFDRIAVVLEIGVDMFAALASRDRRRNDMVVRNSESRSFSNSLGDNNSIQTGLQTKETILDMKLNLSPKYKRNCIDQALSGYKVEIDRIEGNLEACNLAAGASRAPHVCITISRYPPRERGLCSRGPTREGYPTTSSV